MRLPQTVGEYRFVERLGGGAFGTVYRAEIEGDLGYKQECAVKLLDPGRAAAEPEEVAALADEARILSRLHHPAIVHVRRFVHLNHEFLGETWGLEMELVRGFTLDALIQRRRELTLPAIVLILSELLEGLQFAHAARDEEGRPLGLVHRDLKPENIYVTFEGRVKLLDFGIARAEGRIGHETAVGETKGTPLYMSPEQLRGEPIAGTSDLYAIGTLAFELLTPERFVELTDPPDVHAVLRAVGETHFRDRRWLLERSLAERTALTERQRERLLAWVAGLMTESPLERTPTAADALEALVAIPGLYRPHRSREMLKGFVAELAVRREPLEDAFDELPSGAVAAATNLIGPSDRPAPLVLEPPTEQGATSEWLLGGPPPPPLPGPPSPAKRAAPIAIALLIGIAVVVSILQLIGPTDGDAGVDPGPAAETIAAASRMPILEPTPVEPDTDETPPAAEYAVPTTEPTPQAVATPQPTPTPTKPRRVQPRPAGPWGTPAAATATLVHTPPKVAVAGSPLVFRATVEGGDCTPRVFWGPAEGALGNAATFAADGGGAFKATVNVPYDTAHASGIRYYVKCCGEGSDCPAGFRSADSPYLIPAPAF